MWVPRKQLIQKLAKLHRRYPVVTVLGPRQCGKTSLVKKFLPAGKVTYFDLETTSDWNSLTSDAESLLSSLHGTVVIDEAQRLPKLFTLLRPLADRHPLKAKFLLLGSVAPELVKGISESLAGRTGFLDMGGLALWEVSKKNQTRLWLRGGMPRSYTAPNDKVSMEERDNLIRTFLERDLPRLQVRTPSETFRRFLTMVAHYHGQVWNASQIASSLGMSAPAVRHFLDVLSGSFLVRQLRPYYLNLGKRVVKSPKVYYRDSGLLHALLDLGSYRQLSGHPKFGASWEGFALEQLLLLAGEKGAYFWATHNGAELDLLLERGGRRYGFEFKAGDAPKMTRSMGQALKDLQLKKLWVIYPGEKIYPLAKHVEALPLGKLELVGKSLAL